MRQYYIYNASDAPEELIAKHPNHAQYENGKIFLFVESLEQVTGIPHIDVDDMAKRGMKKPPPNEQAELGMSYAQLETAFLSKANTPDGKETHMSIEQGKALWDNRLKSVAEEL